MLYVTAQDLQNTLVRMTGGNSSPEEVLDVRHAIRQALRTVSASHQWPYYHDFHHLLTSEPYSTGTVAYSASTGLVTLTSGTWPTWAAAGVLILDDDHVRVARRNSGTSLTVRTADAPSEDYSGTYTLYRYQYEIDSSINLYKFGKLQVDQVSVLDYVPPGLFETDVRLPYLVTGSKPRCFTVSRGPTVGRTTLSLWPYPTEELRMRFGYIRHPRDVRTWEYTTGTVTTGADSAEVEGTDTVFSSAHVNCLLRTGSNRNAAPTSRDGRNPPVDESVVYAVASETNLTTTQALSATGQDVAYTLSDVLDYDISQMHEVVLYCARYELAKLRNEDIKLQVAHRTHYQDALYWARCQSSGADTVSMAGNNGRSAWPGLWDSYMTFGA
jgi:hypothetical protein